MPFVDKAFARRLEAAEGTPQVQYAKLYEKLYPEVGAAAEEICGAHMVFAGVGSPIGRAVGLGLDAPVSAADLDRLEEFYRSRGAAAQVDVCPLTDTGLLEMLKTRGYRMAELNNVLYRELRAGEEFSLEFRDFSIKPGSQTQADTSADIVSRGFFAQGDAPAEFHRWIAPLFQLPGVAYILGLGRWQSRGRSSRADHRRAQPDRAVGRCHLA